jgi:hypothetical protein
MLKNIAKVSLSVLISLSLFSCSSVNTSKPSTTTATTPSLGIKATTGVNTIAGGGTKSFEEKNVLATEVALTENIRGIATDKDGNVYFADEDAGYIAMVNGEGKLNVVAKDLSHPIGLVVNNAGDVFVAENGSTKQITKLTKKSDGTYEKKSYTSDTFVNIYSITLSNSDPNILYIGDAQNPDIEDDKSVLKQMEISTGTISSLTELTDVIDTAGIITDTNNNLYIADYADANQGKGKLFKYDLKNKKVTILAENLTSPDGLVMDASGNLYLAVDNDKILKYDTSLKQSVFAGGGEKSRETNGNTRTQVSLGELEMVAMTANKDSKGEPTLYYVDKTAKLIREINP